MLAFSLKKEPVSWLAPLISRGRAYNLRQREKIEFRTHLAHLGLPAILGYVVVELEFVFTPPKSASKKLRARMLAGEEYPTQKDCTNCQKFIEDCLKDIVIGDDRYVVRIMSSKRFGEYAEILIKLYGIQEYKELKGTP